jgi:hypothetical protein
MESSRCRKKAIDQLSQRQQRWEKEKPQLSEIKDREFEIGTRCRKTKMVHPFRFGEEPKMGGKWVMNTSIDLQLDLHWTDPIAKKKEKGNRKIVEHA